MCGIIGELNISKKISLNEKEKFKKKIKFLKNRGPDSQGYWSFKDQVQFGFRRLSILDLSKRGNQPFLDKKNNVTLVFNGEIYNYKNLYNRLLKKGAKFKTKSDTEVIIQLYIFEGLSGLKKLRGMFSFAICDTKRKKIFFLRDPHGIKPLYYFRNKETFLFCSTVKGLLQFENIDKKINKNSLNFFYFFGCVKETDTIFEKISSFKPGHLYSLEFNGKFNEKKFFTVDDFFKNPVLKFINIKDKFKKNLEQHLQSDVKVGFLLSSGLDSSVLLGLASEIKKNLVSFTLGFKNFKGTLKDEIPLSHKFSKKIGVNHKYTYLSNPKILSGFKSYFANMDQPSYDGFNTFLITRFIKDHKIKVAISGLGSDEILMGYNTFFRIKLLWYLRFLFQNFFMRLLISKLSIFFGKNKYFIFLRLLSITNNSFQLYLLLRSKKENLAKIKIQNIKKLLNEKFDMPNNLSINEKIIYFETKIYLKNQLLKDVDWASMANSIEMRIPYVDYDFIKFLAASDLLGKINKKSFFKKIFILPKYLINRKKTGFAIPYSKIVELYNKRNKSDFKDWTDVSIYEYFKSVGIKHNKYNYEN